MNAANPSDTILKMAGGYCLNRCLHGVAELGVADFLEDSPKTADELARSVHANPDALVRVLRLLSAYDIFEMKDGRFTHSPASRLLRSDHPRSMRGLARMFGLSMNWAAFDNFYLIIKTGKPVYANSFWERLSEDGHANTIFNEAMAAKANGQVHAVISAYNFEGYNTIGDIGGGRGHLLKAVLDAAPEAKGILFDLPHVIQEAAHLESARLKLVAGDFFKDALPVCDIYLVMEIIHDWADQEAVTILTAIRRAAPANAKILLVESIIPESSGPDWSKMLDIHMLTLLGGRQRTGKEYADLLQNAGFTLEREISTDAGVSILEAYAT